MPKRVEDIRPPTATLTSGLEREIYREVESEAGLLDFSYDQRQLVFEALNRERGNRWPDNQSERNAIINAELGDISRRIEEQFGEEWPSANPDERDMMLKATIKVRFGESHKPTGSSQPKSKGDWIRENEEFLREMRGDDVDRAYERYADRVKSGRIKS